MTKQSANRTPRNFQREKDKLSHSTPGPEAYEPRLSTDFDALDEVRDGEHAGE
jgi:hypothetical protein